MGAQPSLSLNRTSADFGTTSLGTQQSTSVQVSNSGSKAFTLTALRAPSPAFHTTGIRLPLSLKPGTSIDFNITFLPTVTGRQTSELILGTNDPAAPLLRLPLLAEGGLPPQIVLSKTSLYFESPERGSRSQYLTLSNPGGSELRWNCDASGYFSAGSVSGAFHGGKYNVYPRSSGVVPAGGHVDITVSTQATLQTGSFAGVTTATLSFNSNVPNGGAATLRKILPMTLHVYADAAKAVLKESLLDFKTAEVGGNITAVFIVQNAGSASCAITALQMPGAAFSLWGGAALPATIAAHGQASFIILYSPTAIETFTGNIQISTSDPLRPTLTLPVQAAAQVTPTFTALPTSIDFHLTRFRTQTQTVQITNTGTERLDWQADWSTTGLASRAMSSRSGATLSVSDTSSSGATLTTGGAIIIGTGTGTTGGGLVLGTGSTTINPEWTLPISSGSIEAGQTGNVSITVKAGNQGVLDLRYLRIRSASGLRSVTVPVRLYVISGSTISASPVSFQTTHVGESSTSILMLNNLGNQPLHITGITMPSAAYTLEGATFPMAIDYVPGVYGGGAQSITLRYSPTAIADEATELLIASDDPQTPVLLVPITAKAIAPALQAAPTSIAISTDSGVTTSRAVFISHQGRQAVTWTAAVSSDTPALLASALTLVTSSGSLSATPNYAGTNNLGSWLRLSLQAGAWAPQMLSGAIEITTAGGMYPVLRIPIEVTVKARPMLRAEVYDGSSALTMLNFGSVATNVSKTLTLKLSNTGNADLIVSNLVFPSTAISTTQTWPLTLAPGTSASVPITFAPSVVGMVYGAQYVTLATNDATVPTTQVYMQATGVLSAQGQATPVSLTIESGSNTAPWQQIKVTNTGGLPMTMYLPTLSTSLLELNYTSSFTLYAGEVATYYIRHRNALTPTGTTQETFKIKTSSVITPEIVVPITLIVLPRATGYMSSTTTFPLTQRGASSEVNVSVWSTGTAPLVITGATFDKLGFSTTATFPITVQPGTSTTLPMRFAPVLGPTAPRCTMRLVTNSPDTIPFSNYSYQPTGGSVFSTYLDGKTTAFEPLSVLPAEITASLRNGEQGIVLTRSLTLYNNTAGSLQAKTTLTADAPSWLQLPTSGVNWSYLDYNGGTALQGVLLNASGLNAGPHHSSVNVQPATTPATPAISVPVTLTVAEADFELTSSSSTSLTAVEAVPPLPQTITWRSLDANHPASVVARSRVPWLKVVPVAGQDAFQVSFDMTDQYYYSGRRSGSIFLESASTVREVSYSLFMDESRIAALVADDTRGCVYALHHPAHYSDTDVKPVLARYRLPSGQLDASLELDEGAFNMAINPTHGVLHIARDGLHGHGIVNVRLSDFSIASRDTVAAAFSGMVVNPNGILFLSGGIDASSNALVQAYDYTAHRLVAEYKFTQPYYTIGARIGLAPEGGQLWVRSIDGNQSGKGWLSRLEFKGSSFGLQQHTLIMIQDGSDTIYNQGAPLKFTEDGNSYYLNSIRFSAIKPGSPPISNSPLGYASRGIVVLSADHRLVADGSHVFADAQPGVSVPAAIGSDAATFANDDSLLVSMKENYTQPGHTLQVLNLAKLRVLDRSATPAVELDATHALDFGQVVAGKAMTRSLTLASVGGNTLTGLGNVRFGGPDAAAVSLLTRPGGLKLHVLDETRCQVQLRPTVAGTGDAWLEVQSSDASQPTYRVALTWNASSTGLAPSIVAQPASQIKAPGSSVTFTVQAEGTGPLNYVWNHNGKLISGQRSATLTLTNIAADDAGLYQATLSNNFGRMMSQTAALVVARVSASTQQREALHGRALKLASGIVLGVGSSFEWQHDGQAIADGADFTGSSTDTLTIQQASAPSAGLFTLRLAGDATSPVLVSFQVSVLLIPSIDTATLGPWSKGGRVEDVFFSSSPVTRWSAKGMPAGVLLDPTSGLLTGSPTTAGSYTVQATATNAAGSTRRSYTLQVSGAPNVAGSYVGLFDRASLNADMGEQLLLVISSRGSFTGKLRGTRSRPALTGHLEWNAERTLAHARVAMGAGCELLLNVSASGECNGSVVDDTSHSDLRMSSVVGNTSAWKGYYTAVMENQGGSDGNGIIQMSIAANGTATLTARLRDGVAATYSGRLTTDDTLPLLLMPHGPGVADTTLGWLRLTATSGSGGAWLDATLNRKKVGTEADLQGVHRLYATIPLHDLSLAGGRYLPPATGTRPLNLAAKEANAGLEIYRWANSNLITVPLTVTAKGARMQANDYDAHISLEPATGVFSGSFVLSERFSTYWVHRTAPFHGVLVPRLGRGAGYYTMQWYYNYYGYASGPEIVVDGVVLQPAP